MNIQCSVVIRLMILLTVAVPVVRAQAATPIPIARTRPDGTPNLAAWMAEGRFGLMVHYLPRPLDGTREERQAWLDRTVDAFDLDGFMRQFEAIGADWLIFTLTQTNGVMTSPNPVLDPKAAQLVARRDLVMEIAQRIRQANKRLILYLPSSSDGGFMARMVSKPDDDNQWYFQFIGAYSEKFGRLHHGWWFDACSTLPLEEWRRWIAACRAGNPDVVVAFSGAEFCTGGPIEPRCPIEDYHAGEIHVLDGGRIRRDFLVPGGTYFLRPDGVLQKEGQEPRYYMPDGQFLGGVQWHALLPIDLTFNPAIPDRMCRYSDRELFGFVTAVKSVGGAITINVPIDIQTGLISADSHAQLVRLRRYLEK